MKNDLTPSDLYIRFLGLVRAVRQLPSFPSLDATEEQLLNAVELQRHAGQRLTVLEVMGLLPDVSPSTSHRRLKNLRAKGLITLQVDEADNRIKYVTPTPLAREYFSQLGRAISEAGEGVDPSMTSGGPPSKEAKAR